MLTLFFEDSGLLREDARILSVGAGHETVLFWLANRVAQGRGDRHLRRGKLQRGRGGSNDAHRPCVVLAVPLPRVAPRGAAHGRQAARVPGRLVRRGLHAVVDRALRIVGGHPARGERDGPRRQAGRRAYITTECFLGRSALTPFAQEATSKVTGGRMFGSMRVFTPESLVSEIVEPSGLELVQPLDATPPETVPNVIDAGEGPTGRVGRRDADSRTSPCGRSGSERAPRAGPPSGWRWPSRPARAG